ncbi:hypothetical protein [Providencia stuartii]|uniref:hypothetical protein n=1 Tax=Providencia stuartii TaxID=588 RepID=UPI001B70EA62|nr:hypothetical protein [Providencia stuartii]MBQ0693486.1 hypothetical protein [Providencia stuartii]
MTESNQEKYINSLLAGHDKNSKSSKDNILELKVKTKTLDKIRDIKNYMEWDTDTTLNSALTYLYKNSGFDVFSKYGDYGDKIIKFSPTFKNSQRLQEVKGNVALDLECIAVIICKSIDELHSILLKADE